MAAAIVILSVLVVFLIVYLVSLQFQIRGISRQLKKRLAERTRQPVRLELINRDLTKLAVLINQCLRAEETLRMETLREEKHFKEMIANISHDLRTPLTAIKGYQQLLAKESLEDRQRQKLEIAQKHADELGSLIEHFFEYSYLLNAEPNLNPERMNLTNFTAECIAESAALFEERQLAVRFEESPPVYAQADKEMVKRIIRNLIRNCVQHSDSDVHVRIQSNNNAVLSFGNRVKNPSEINAEQLFNRFYTSDRARQKSTGLGLAIVKLLAEQMGGSIGAALTEDFLEIRVELPLSIPK